MTDASPVPDRLNPVVRDAAAVLAFYRRLGLDIADGAVWRTASGAHHAKAALRNDLHLEFDGVALAKVLQRRVARTGARRKPQRPRFLAAVARRCRPALRRVDRRRLWRPPAAP